MYVFKPIWDFWRKKLIFGTRLVFTWQMQSAINFTDFRFILEKQMDAKSGINTAMYDFLFVCFL